LEAGSGSTLLPGPGIASLTVTENLTMAGVVLMELNRTNVQTCDRLEVGGSLAAGGTLTVTNRGPALQSGDTFLLFSQPASGFSGVNLPALDAGLVWVDRLATDGSLAVAPVVSTEPVEVVAQVTSGMLTLSWPADHTGWHLQVQTNASGAGLSTNWFDVADSETTNEMTFPVEPTSGSAFYRLKFP
jgi:hypothetical protein